MKRISKEKKLAAKNKLLKIVNSCTSLIHLDMVCVMMDRFCELFVDDEEDFGWYMEIDNAYSEKLNSLLI